MATLVVLAAGITDAISSDITVSAGQTAVVGLSSTAPSKIPYSPAFEVRSTTNADPTSFCQLTANNPTTLIEAPSTSALVVNVHRPALQVGSETAVYVTQ